MKKILFLMIVVLSHIYGLKAQVLDKVFQTVEALPNSVVMDQKAALKLMLKNKWQYDFISYKMCILGNGLSDNELNETQPQVQEIMEEIPRSIKLIEAYSSFNAFMVAYEPTEKTDELLVMIFNQSNYYGERIMILGKMSRTNLKLLDAGDINMGYYGTTITPMPLRIFEAYNEIQNDIDELHEEIKNKTINKQDALKEEEI